MRNYTVADSASPRFEGEFKFEPKPDAAAELKNDPAYLKVGPAVETLAGDEAKDKDAKYPDALLTARKAERKTSAKNLRAIAQKFIDEKSSSEETVAAIDAELARYAKALPKFGVRDKKPGAFEGDFELMVADGYEPAEAEARYRKKLHELLEEMANNATAPSGDLSQSALEERKALRTRVAGTLKERAEQFCTGKATADACSDHALIVTGRYRAVRDRFARTLFNVTGVTEDEANQDVGKRFVDVNIALLPNLPAPADKATPAQEDLFTQINKTVTVIRLVCERMKDPPKDFWGRPAEDADHLMVERSRRYLHEYMDKLRGIAIVGLQQPHANIAKLALNELRSEFTMQQAGQIKNRYVRKLGEAALLAVVIFMAAYISMHFCYGDWQACTWKWGQMHKSFLLAGTGAAVGAWVSFSVRQVQLSFDDLLLLEDSALDPPLRILFVVALTWTACLLFWTGTFNIEIGNLRTSADAFQRAGSIALLIGIFCGLSERALATAISGRAAAFVQGVAGSR